MPVTIKVTVFLNVESITGWRVGWVVFSLNFLILGIYDILGAAFEFKIAHCVIQSMYHLKMNPQNNIWTRKEKRESIICGSILIGMAVILFLLPIFFQN